MRPEKIYMLHEFVTNGVHRSRSWTRIAPSESARRCASFRGIPDICGTNFEGFLNGGGERRTKQEVRKTTTAQWRDTAEHGQRGGQRGREGHRPPPCGCSGSARGARARLRGGSPVDMGSHTHTHTVGLRNDDGTGVTGFLLVTLATRVRGRSRSEDVRTKHSARGGPHKAGESRCPELSRTSKRVPREQVSQAPRTTAEENRRSCFSCVLLRSGAHSPQAHTPHLSTLRVYAETSTGPPTRARARGCSLARGRC